MKIEPSLLAIAITTLLVNTFLIGTSNASPEAVTMPYEPDPKVVVDGIVSIDEYVDSYFEMITGIYVNWEHNGTHMYIAVESPGTGWVGIGFGVINTGMDGANMIIGYVDDSTGALVLEDVWGIKYTHSNDTFLGGSRDFVAEAGSQSNGKTVIEFVFPLDSGDSYDFRLSPGGTYGFFVAYQATEDDLVSYHTVYSETKDFYIEPKVTPGNQPPTVDFSYTSTGLTVKFVDQSQDPDGTIDSWSWNFGDGVNSTEKNPVHIFPEMDSYAVSLTVADDQGDISIISKEVIVPSANERMQLWITQIAVVSLAIAFLSFVAVVMTRRTRM